MLKYGEAAEAKEGESFGRGEVVEVEADETSMAAVEVLMSSDQNDSFCQGGDSMVCSSSPVDILIIKTAREKRHSHLTNNC